MNRRLEACRSLRLQSACPFCLYGPGCCDDETRAQNAFDERLPGQRGGVREDDDPYPVGFQYFSAATQRNAELPAKVLGIVCARALRMRSIYDYLSVLRDQTPASPFGQDLVCPNHGPVSEVGVGNRVEVGRIRVQEVNEVVGKGELLGWAMNHVPRRSQSRVAPSNMAHNLVQKSHAGVFGMRWVRLEEVPDHADGLPRESELVGSPAVCSPATEGRVPFYKASYQQRGQAAKQPVGDRNPARPSCVKGLQYQREKRALTGGVAVREPLEPVQRRREAPRFSRRPLIDGQPRAPLRQCLVGPAVELVERGLLRLSQRKQGLVAIGVGGCYDLNRGGGLRTLPDDA